MFHQSCTTWKYPELCLILLFCLPLANETKKFVFCFSISLLISLHILYLFALFPYNPLPFQYLSSIYFPFSMQLSLTVSLRQLFEGYQKPICWKQKKACWSPFYISQLLLQSLQKVCQMGAIPAALDLDPTVQCLQSVNQHPLTSKSLGYMLQKRLLGFLPALEP